MLSKKFQLIVLFSLLLHWLHGVECTLTKYYEVGPVFMDYFHTVKETAYLAFHIPFYIFLLLAFLLLQRGRWMFIPLALYGMIFFTEFHHFLRGVVQMNYYPGMITSFFFPFIGILYFKELIKLWKTK